MNQIGKVSTDREGVAGAHVMAQLALDYHDQVRDLAGFDGFLLDSLRIERKNKRSIFYVKLTRQGWHYIKVLDIKTKELSPDTVLTCWMAAHLSKLE